jgi:DNA repair protein RadC
MKLHDISPENRPRERLEFQGPGALSDAELLALILKSGTQKNNVLEMCQKILSKYGLDGLSTTTLHELQQEHGIGKAKASQVIALFELYKRTQRVTTVKKTIESAAEIALIYTPRMKHLTKEHFLAVYLDTKNKIICDQVITVGTLNASLVHPREVFHGAIKNLANSVVVLHNHPSGDPTPSEEDLKVTEKLVATGEVMGIDLLDHLIITKNGYWSWNEQKI